MNKDSIFGQIPFSKTMALIGSLLMFFCFIMPSANSQIVFRDKNGELSIQMPDGSLRTVQPSDSILYRHAFDNILPLPEKEKSTTAESVGSDRITGTGLMDEREVSIGINIRTTENRIRFLHSRIVELEEKIETLQVNLEFARANPGRIRPNERIELSNAYNSAVDEKARAVREIPLLEKDLVLMKRQNHLDVLAQLKLPDVPVISRHYFLSHFEIKGEFRQGKKDPSSSPETLVWEAPGDIPMPIIPHPTSVEIRDVIKNPPSRSCRLISSDQESAIKNFLIRTESENLSFHLPAEMRIHRRGRPMLSIDSHFEVRQGGKFIVLDIYLMIPSARRSMGGVRKNSPVRMEMMNGEIVNLRVVNDDSGTFFQDLNEVHFRAIAPLSKEDFRKLSENEIDKLRLFWDSGYEDYEVFDIRVLKHQLNCLNEYISKK